MITPYFLENFWVSRAFKLQLFTAGAVPHYSLAVFASYHSRVSQRIER